MAEHSKTPPLGEQGFTLLELLVALGILVVGLTSLMALLTVGVSTRRSAEQRNRATLAVDHVMIEAAAAVRAQLGTDRVASNADEAPPERPALTPFTLTTIAGFPGLKATVEPTMTPDTPDLVLLKATITWLEQGEALGDTFYQLADVRPTFVARVASSRSKP